jgi:hypothetical protein
MLSSRRNDLLTNDNRENDVTRFAGKASALNVPKNEKVTDENIAATPLKGSFAYFVTRFIDCK